MRPENTEPKDAIENLLKKSWEDPPENLEHRLMKIPAQLNDRKSWIIDPLSWILNVILLVWGIGLATYFWAPLESFILSTSKTILGLSGQAPHLLSQPWAGLILIGIVLAGWVMLDLEKHPHQT